jgi:signal transduction histidine kinase
LCFSLGVSLYFGRLIAGKFVDGIKRITKSARKIESGNYTERVAHGTEGSEINNLVDAFNDMTDNTEKLLSELKTISDNMAHDLRTPLTRMRGMAEMSLGNSKDNELASDVAEECANMLTMINAMLEITQTECNLGNPVRTPLDFAAIVGDTVNLLSTVADDKGVSIKTDIPETALPFLGNKVQLQRLIANLLDNAIKFTPFGGAVSVSVKQDDGSVLLTVADTGCGIPEKDRGHVFDRFYRSDASRNISGNGLGLSLVKAIVDSYGGEISFSSEEGRGTVFTLTLPKRRPVGEEG